MTTASTPLPVESSAPGSMMLMGEYAVLTGSRAVLMTLKHRLRVKLVLDPPLPPRSGWERVGVRGGGTIAMSASGMSLDSSKNPDPSLRQACENTTPPSPCADDVRASLSHPQRAGGEGGGDLNGFYSITSDKFDPYTEGETPKPPHVVLCDNVLSRFFEFYESGTTKAQTVMLDLIRHPDCLGRRNECGVTMGGGEETKRPFQLTISSDIPPTYGFASSAALVAALVKALHEAFDIKASFRDMFRIGHQAILDTFQRGSGADLAAALADMPFLIFDPKAISVTPFTMPFAVQALYVGYKTPTPQVLAQVAETIPPSTFSKITKDMADCVDDFIASPRLDLITIYQSYMDALGVTCDSCRLALDMFAHQGIAAKISGSGRGDCVIGFGANKPLSDIKLPFVLFSQGELQP